MEKKRFKMALWAAALLLLVTLLTVLAFQTYAYLNASPQISQADLSRAYSGRISLPENAVFQGGWKSLTAGAFGLRIRLMAEHILKNSCLQKKR